ncbi:MAG: helix-turn-helix domain-containing protein [Fibrobacteres bacterium]|nr:helix-turn-helix domain-containing protein [Fibrobacterota bacterium]
MTDDTESTQTLDANENEKSEQAVPEAAPGKTRVYDFSILRNLRKAQGFTIADIAQASGISTAVISRIERNQAVPELDTLSRLGKAFGISATDLLGLAEFRTAQTTHSQHYVSGGFQFQHINFINIQCFLGSAMAGGTVNRPEVHHNDHEICWVLQGSIEMVLNDEQHVLKEGDALQFDAVLPHSYRALSDCRILTLHIRKGKQI